jgi:hypothetical protein
MSLDLSKLESVLNAINARLTAIEGKIENGGSAGGASSASGDDDGLSKLAAEFDAVVIKGAAVKAIVDSTQALGGDAAKLVRIA